MKRNRPIIDDFKLEPPTITREMVEELLISHDVNAVLRGKKVKLLTVGVGIGCQPPNERRTRNEKRGGNQGDN